MTSTRGASAGVPSFSANSSRTPAGTRCPVPARRPRARAGIRRRPWLPSASNRPTAVLHVEQRPRGDRVRVRMATGSGMPAVWPMVVADCAWAGPCRQAHPAGSRPGCGLRPYRAAPAEGQTVNCSIMIRSSQVALGVEQQGHAALLLFPHQHLDDVADLVRIGGGADGVRADRARGIALRCRTSVPRRASDAGGGTARSGSG